MAEFPRAEATPEAVGAVRAAMARAGELDPEAIRAVARQRFSHERMTAAYLDRYQQLAGGAARAAA